MTRYPLDRLHEEVAYVAFHFHWQHRDIMQMEHRERHRWVSEIARLNQRLSADQNHPTQNHPAQNHPQNYSQNGGRR